MIHACMDYDPWCISVELVQMQHMTTQRRLHVTTLTGDIYKRIICMVIAENNDQWPKESNLLQCSQSCSEVRRETNVQSWLFALTCECRGSFVAPQRLLHGHCCPPQTNLAVNGTSMSSAALHGRSVGCNCAWSAHYSWMVAAASQKYRNIRCLLRGYVHTNVSRRGLLRYQDHLWR